MPAGRPGPLAAPAAALFLAAVLNAAGLSAAAASRTLEPPGLDKEVLSLALRAAGFARARGLAPGRNRLTIIDYSLPSTAKRLWVLDLDASETLFHELVAHGRRTGEDRAELFSNRLASRMSSLGLYRTSGTFEGVHGYSLRLEGLERGWNDNALARDIVLHGASYVSPEFARQNGRLGRSWGCPAVSKEAAAPVIDAIKGGTLLFVYYPETKWLAESEFLR